MFLSSLVLALSRPALPAYGIPPAHTTNLTLYHVRGRRILCPRVGRILFYLHSHTSHTRPRSQMPLQVNPKGLGWNPVNMVRHVRTLRDPLPQTGVPRQPPL